MFNELASLAVHNLMRARARLIMTAGGVLVGTTAVILLIALTIGLQSAAEAGIGQNASLTEIRVYPNYGMFFGPGAPQPAEEDSDPPTLDVATVQTFWNIPGVAAVIPIVELQGWAELVADPYRGGGQILGVDARLLSYLGVQAQQGALSLEGDQIIVGSLLSQNFYDPEAESYAPVTVDLMTTPLEMTLYNNDGTDNRELDIEVAGVLAPGTSFDYAILFPADRLIELNEFTSGQEFDPDTFTFSQVIVRATGRDTTMSVTETLRELGFNAGGIGDFLNELNNFFGTMRLMLGGVGGVALLVAAFGVANTMTMAILERTREIGLMKAIGATDRDVLTVFLIEAGMVGLCGGIAGVLTAFGLQNLINQAIASAPQGEQGGITFLPIDTSQLDGGLMIIPPELAVFAMVLATSVGLFAGFYPALRAARMTTVVALKTD
ncbi:MAG: ABC transporter permease [bacterium]|nr:ABC transporter permease [bacterium]